MIHHHALDIVLMKLPEHIRAPLSRTRHIYESDVQELVLRSGRPITIYAKNKVYFPTVGSVLTDSCDTGDVLICDRNDMNEVFRSICDFSVYSRQNEINNGFITVEGGVRVGICGTAVTHQESIVNIKDITTLSFRIPREILHCSDTILKVIHPLDGVLICGPPSSGKTTIIRDISRTLSYRYKVSLIDERAEISACGCYDIGLSDVFLSMPKGKAVTSAIRSMSPDVIICDELGDTSDIEMIQRSLRCGVSFIATIHASSLDDLRKRHVTAELLATGAFRYVVFLNSRENAGCIKKIYELRDTYH